MLPGSPAKSKVVAVVEHNALYGFANGKLPNYGRGVFTAGWLFGFAYPVESPSSPSHLTIADYPESHFGFYVPFNLLQKYFNIINYNIEFCKTI